LRKHLWFSMFPQMFPCLPTREAKMFPSKFRNIWCFPMFLTNASYSVCPLWETWRNIGRKQCFRNNVS
jgi:hypothetical protein